ncbi:MAG: ATP-binding cassette domain-containing protein [Olsenella sp.]|jgi:ABC-type oligopeptide transport system ATPase subunit
MSEPSEKEGRCGRAGVEGVAATAGGAPRTDGPGTEAPLLRVEHLTKSYPLAGKGFRRERFRAVDDLSFEIGEGEVYGLVGESGSGKSTTGRLILGLERPDSGSVLYRGRDLVGLSERERKPLRREMQLVFQDSSAAFDPRNRAGRILEEPLVIAGEGDAAERRERALESLALVGLQREHYDAFPHELSGGQRQRLNLARALITGPRLLICDEPVSALDVSVQAQVLNLLVGLRRKTGVSMLFITHDMRVVRHMADRMGVLHHGRLVEEGPALEVIAHPQDSYTRSLIDAIP